MHANLTSFHSWTFPMQDVFDGDVHTPFWATKPNLGLVRLYRMCVMVQLSKLSTRDNRGREREWFACHLKFAVNTGRCIIKSVSNQDELCQVRWRRTLTWHMTGNWKWKRGRAIGPDAERCQNGKTRLASEIAGRFLDSFALLELDKNWRLGIRASFCSKCWKVSKLMAH